jgi:Sec-independent protein translocase protein TatA
MGGRGRRISEFKASLVYKVSSRTARATQRNPVSKNQKKKKKKTNKKQKQKQQKKKNKEKQKLCSKHITH